MGRRFLGGSKVQHTQNRKPDLALGAEAIPQAVWRLFLPGSCAVVSNLSSRLQQNINREQTQHRIFWSGNYFPQIDLSQLLGSLQSNSQEVFFKLFAHPNFLSK